MTKERQAGSLKAAVYDLVQECGGNEAVGKLLGCSAENVRRMADCDDRQHVPRIEQIVLLERHCGEAIVTSWMAGQSNCIVEPVVCENVAPVATVIGKLTEEFADVLADAGIAVATGRLTHISAKPILRETNDLVCVLVDLRARCRDAIKRRLT